MSIIEKFEQARNEFGKDNRKQTATVKLTAVELTMLIELITIAEAIAKMVRR